MNCMWIKNIKILYFPRIKANVKAMDEYRQFIIDRFDGMSKLAESQHALVQFQLKTISEQTEETEKKANEIDKQLRELTNSESKHYAECPIKKKAEETEKNLAQVLFIIKYWKPFAYGAAFFVLSLIYAGKLGIDKFEHIDNEILIEKKVSRVTSENVDVNTRMIDKMNLNGVIDKNMNENNQPK